jgi:endonuclease V-like protein UPF0215 family
LDDREQKEVFFDAESLRWFMMDSLRMPFVNNIDAENVYNRTRADVLIYLMA